MAFCLSFSEEFFFAEGEPYDAPGLSLNAKGEPTSVWSAIECLRLNLPEQWASLAKDLFGLDKPELLMNEAVLGAIQEANTCTSLSSPVEVWIDPKGDYRIRIYEKA